MFPAAYVRVTVPLADEEPPAARADGWPATALYDFAPQEPDDLALTAGEQVLVQGRLNDEWGCGSAGGRRGQFPLVFVDVDPGCLPVL
ncbi:uncharacterized protein B0303.7-like [Pollicipes pollicipes]|uniref:uncharacterized protein B0303.7-like n=1 Tax=Pollicipes pollicipes TaxID=41117 RepID=UPI00188544B5|nr:uncharacterized protein B0303.7-like [Pollicipes pollicipes]